MFEFQLFGVTVRLSVLFPAVVILLLSLDNVPVLACLAASCIHEAGHALMMLAVRDRPCRVTVGIFGIRIERSSDRLLSYRAACLVSLGGPLANVICAVCLWDHASAVIHIMLAICNLLPVCALDGGEALYAALCAMHDEEYAARIVNRISYVTVSVMALLGIAIWWVSGYNFTLFVLSLYLLIFLFLKDRH